MKVLLASNNQHKRLEIDAILRDLGVDIELIRPHELGLSFDVEEDGSTFAANAYKKAEGTAMLLRGTILPGVTVRSTVVHTLRGDIPPVLADDSGICVHALEKRPGVYSARYGNRPDKPPLTDEQRNDRLLTELASFGDRRAYYVCNAVLFYDPDRYIQVQEIWNGEIALSPAYGETGFGYDPVFLEPDTGKTVAQIPQDHKNRISHRAQALRKLAAAAGWISCST